MESFKNDFLNFCIKVSYWIWVLGYVTGWIFISYIFNDYSQNPAFFPRPKTLDLHKSPNSNCLLTIKESTVLWSPLLHREQIKCANFCTRSNHRILILGHIYFKTSMGEYLKKIFGSKGAQVTEILTSKILKRHMFRPKKKSMFPDWFY